MDQRAFINLIVSTHVCQCTREYVAGSVVFLGQADHYAAALCSCGATSYFNVYGERVLLDHSANTRLKMLSLLEAVKASPLINNEDPTKVVPITGDDVLAVHEWVKDYSRAKLGPEMKSFTFTPVPANPTKPHPEISLPPKFGNQNTRYDSDSLDL